MKRSIIVIVSLTVGLLHFVTGPGYAGPYPRFVNGYLIDILLPFSLYLLSGLIEINIIKRPAVRGLGIFGIGAAVEILQSRGMAAFGRTYDPLDFLAYAFGVVLGIFFERSILSRFDKQSHTR